MHVCRYQAKPTEKHLYAVKRIFKYLRGTINWGLWYPKDSSIALTAYADADHARCQDTRRSTFGCMQLLGDRLVSWSSKRQTSAAISITKDEINCMSCCSSNPWDEIIAYHSMALDSIQIQCTMITESRYCLMLQQCSTFSSSKHIDIRFHFNKDSN
ncbi:hypothetical protein Tco_0651946 [Tanacetum coccineum]|uniref:Reverse transcriptase Ty1/copia-type domain-containing protein n=1 Tax=Tanacetum coccineum TaxID=301880 RepID=A0ABQ4WW71_9ASTR